MNSIFIENCFLSIFVFKSCQVFILNFVNFFLYIMAGNAPHPHRADRMGGMDVGCFVEQSSYVATSSSTSPFKKAFSKISYFLIKIVFSLRLSYFLNFKVFIMLKKFKSTGNPIFDQALQAMIDQMSLANNTPATQVSYVRGVRQLIFSNNKLPEDYTVQQIKHFLVQLRDTGRLSASSINIQVCGLKYYFRHVANRLDLVVKIPNSRIAKYHTEVLDPREIQQLFDACRDTKQLLVVQLLFDTKSLHTIK